MAQDQHTATKSASLQGGRREREMSIRYLEDGRALLAAGKPIPLEFLPDPVKLGKKITIDEGLASKDPDKNRFIAENKGILGYILKELGFEEFPGSDMGKIKLGMTWKYAVSSKENHQKTKSEHRRRSKADYKYDINLKDRTDLTTEEKEEVYGLLERLSTFKEDVKTFCNYNVAAIRALGRAAMVKESSINRYKDLSVPEALEIRRREEEIPTRDLPNPVRLIQDIRSKKSHGKEEELNHLLEYILNKISFISRTNKENEVELELIWMIATQSDTYNDLCGRLESKEGEEGVKKDAMTFHAKYQKKKSEFVLKHGLKNNVAVQSLLDQMSRDQESLAGLFRGKRVPASLSPTTTSSIPRKRTHGDGGTKGKGQEGQEQRKGYDLGMKPEHIQSLIDFNKPDKPR